MPRPIGQPSTSENDDGKQHGKHGNKIIRASMSTEPKRTDFMSETPMPQTELKPTGQTGSIDFVQALRLREEQHPGNEIQRRRVVVEDEWQTTEDCLDDALFADASFYLSRMISEAKRLLRAIDGIGENVICPKSSVADTLSLFQIKRYPTGSHARRSVKIIDDYTFGAYTVFP